MIFLREVNPLHWAYDFVIILGKGINVDLGIIKAMMEWPILKNAHQVEVME